jgi:putative transcriptional regulator
MTIQHHPPYELLTGFASGTLDFGQHVSIATHLVACSQCAHTIHTLEHVGGSVLANLPPSSMSPGAFQKTEARLTRPEAAKASGMSPVPAVDATDRLPSFVRALPMGPWRWVAPRMSLAPILLPQPSATRVFLLKSGPGTRIVEHTHTGLEIACVLQGAFTHDGRRYDRGDFDVGDATMDHDVFVEEGDDCICLIGLQGELRFKGLMGHLLQPFVHI